MPTIKEEYKIQERILDMCLNHSSYNEDDVFNAITRAANAKIRKMEELESKAELRGWDYWIL